MKKRFMLAVIISVVIIIFTQFAYGEVQDIHGRYARIWKVRILKFITEPQLYEFKDKKYDLKSLAQYIKKLNEEEGKRLSVSWQIEIEATESYDSIQELAEVLKHFKYSYINITPAGIK